MRPPRRSAARAAAGLALVGALALLTGGAAGRGGAGAATPPTGAPAGWDVAPLGQVDQTRVRAELARVLDSAELRAVGRPRDATTLVATLWLRAQAWLAHQPAGVTRGVVVACLLVLLAVGAHLVFAVRAVLRGDRRAAGAVVPDERRRSPAELRAAAAAAAARGEHAAGVRLLYLAALRSLDQGGVCDVAAGTADWTVVARCAAAPSVAAPLRELVTAFQGSRFGGRPCGRDEFDRCLGHLDAIARAGAARAAGAGPVEAAG